jgi:hypothetical protein
MKSRNSLWYVLYVTMATYLDIYGACLKIFRCHLIRTVIGRGIYRASPVAVRECLTFDIALLSSVEQFESLAKAPGLRSPSTCFLFHGYRHHVDSVLFWCIAAWPMLPQQCISVSCRMAMGLPAIEGDHHTDKPHRTSVGYRATVSSSPSQD